LGNPDTTNNPAVHKKVTEPVKIVLDCLIDSHLEGVEKFDGGWQFNFTANKLTCETGWRVVSSDKIELTNQDHGQQFGRGSTIDAAADVAHLLRRYTVTDVQLDPICADLNLIFGPTLRLQIINGSSGFEAWTLETTKGELIGRNGDVELFPR
jgi:hypothetical protein